MSKYDENRSIHEEHRAFCSDWKLDGGNDFVDEALSLADDQVNAKREHGESFRPGRVELAKMIEDFLKAGGQVWMVPAQK